MRALREFRGFPPSSKLKAPKLQIGVWLGGQRLCQPGLHLIRSWASRAMRITSAIRAGLERLHGKAFRGFERKITSVTCFPWLTMKTDQPRWEGLVDGCTLSCGAMVLGRLPMVYRMLVTCVVTCGAKTKGLHRCKPLFFMVRHQKSNFRLCY